MSKERGKFNLVGTGIAGVLALIAVGGGIFAFSSLRNNSSPSINVEGSSATGGSATGSSATGGSATGGDITINQDGGTQSSENSPVSNDRDLTKTNSSSNASLSLKSKNLELSLKYPIYQDREGTCKFMGYSSVVLKKEQSGQFFYGGGLNGYYGSGTIQGTVSPSGKLTLNLNQNGSPNRIVTMEAEISSSNSEVISVTGKSFSVDCPDSDFEAAISVTPE